jgi:hypothetical protein
MVLFHYVFAFGFIRNKVIIHENYPQRWRWPCNLNPAGYFHGGDLDITNSRRRCK